MSVTEIGLLEWFFALRLIYASKVLEDLAFATKKLSAIGAITIERVVGLRGIRFVLNRYLNSFGKSYKI